MEVVEKENNPEKKISIKKKSFQWSNIFGIDRKKKSVGLIYHPLEEADRRRKRCGPGECKEEDYSEFVGICSQVYEKLNFPSPLIV